MKKFNLWKSEYTGEIYEMPTDWVPKFGGWVLIGTIEKQSFSFARPGEQVFAEQFYPCSQPMLTDEKIFFIFSKKGLTNHAKCGTIYLSRGERRRQNPRKTIGGLIPHVV